MMQRCIRILVIVQAFSVEVFENSLREIRGTLRDVAMKFQFV